MQLIHSYISFLEVQIVTIRHGRVIAHPLADFRQAFSGDGEKRAKGMAHDMRRDPGKSNVERVGIATISSAPLISIWNA